MVSQEIAQTYAPPEMIWIPGGTFRMGSANFYPEERPLREVTVDGFWMDRYEVTNEQFSRFVAVGDAKHPAARAAPAGDPFDIDAFADGSFAET